MRFVVYLLLFIHSFLFLFSIFAFCTHMIVFNGESSFSLFLVIVVDN